MAGLEDTMQHARRTLAAEPVLQPRPLRRQSHRLTARSRPDDIDSDIAARLDRLDSACRRGAGRDVDGTDDDAIRHAIACWVDEWADDVAEDWADEDAEAARAAGRQEAIAMLEEEVNLIDEPLTPDSQG